jgi:hypothetical protein
MSKSIYGSIKATTCCGLKEFHELSSWSGYNINIFQTGYSFSTVKAPGTGYIATTNGRQKAEAKCLKANGFKRVGSWRNANTGSTVTLWFYGPKKRKKNARKRK